MIAELVETGFPEKLVQPPQADPVTRYCTLYWFALVGAVQDTVAPLEVMLAGAAKARTGETTVPVCGVQVKVKPLAGFMVALAA